MTLRENIDGLEKTVAEHDPHIWSYILYTTRYQEFIEQNELRLGLEQIIIACYNIEISDCLREEIIKAVEESGIPKNTDIGWAYAAFNPNNRKR